MIYKKLQMIIIKVRIIKQFLNYQLNNYQMKLKNLKLINYHKLNNKLIIKINNPKLKVKKRHKM